MTRMRYVPHQIPQGPPLDGPVLLRNGRPAYLRVIRPDDRPELVALIERSSKVSRFFRFFGGIRPSSEAADRLIGGRIASDDEEAAATDTDLQLADANRQAGTQEPVAHSDPKPSDVQEEMADGLTLVVTIGDGEDGKIIGVAGYTEHAPNEAEIAFLVEDEYQGKGVGTLLLERLAMAAERNGIERLTAYVLPDNVKMIQVFKDSGFEVVSTSEEGEMHISLDIEPTERSVEEAERRDQIATRASLEPFFRPRSVAVVGASRNPASIGHRVLLNLISAGFTGPVFPINPKADVVASIPAYPSVKDVPRDVDLAVIAVPQPAVLSVVDDCAEKGVRALIVLTAGFAETGEEGRELQDRLVSKVRGYGMRMVGPNCLGLLNTDPEIGLNATFGPVAPPAGRVAMSSQSGALGLAIIEYARDLGVGLSSFVSVGNKADVSGNDLLQYWEDDPGTDVILLYLESFGNPRRFARIARRVARKKPILAVKSGRTSAGRKAAGSHTAALAASDVGADALFQQAGVIRADTLEEMFDVASLLAHQPIPKGNRMAILTNAGGPGILCADTAEAEGLVLPELGEDTQAALREFLPPAASVSNPVDMVASASADDYRRALEVLLKDDQIDSVITIFIPTGAADSDAVAKGIRDGWMAADKVEEKPLLACFMSEKGLSEALTVNKRSVPSYKFPESAARALARAAEYGAWLQKEQGVIPLQPEIDVEKAKSICDEVIAKRGGGWLLPDEVDNLLASFGIRTVPAEFCTSPDAAVEAAERLGYPVVVKLASTTLVHKSEWDGVVLDLHDADGVRAAWDSIRGRLVEAGKEAEMAGVTVQKMAPGGTEVMIGMTEDPSFGPLIAFGLGGVTVELLGDVVFRITPLTDQDAKEMIQGIRGAKLLEGFRGSPVRDRQAVIDILLRISRLVEELPVISEIDFNPVRVYTDGEGAEVLDARILLKGNE